MRNNRNSPDSAGDRLGPLASLMRAAEPLDQLSAAERERIKLRLRGDRAGRRAAARLRLVTAMAGCGLLLAGGVAMAGRLGLIRWPGATRSLPAGVDKVDETPRRPMRGHARTSTPAAPERNDPAASMGAVPAPLAPVATPVAPAPTDTQAAPPASRAQTTHARRGQTAVKAAKPRDSVREEPLGDPAPSALVPPAPAPVPLHAPADPHPSLAMVMPTEARPRVPKTTPASTAAPNPQDLLGQAMRSLRHQHDPAAALDILTRHAALFPRSPLGGERNLLEVEALLALGRYPEALLRLDGMDLGKVPRSAERLVVRGELRAQAHRWNQAAADFDQALAHLHGLSPWHERALWGRATARAHFGDRGGSRTDMRLYLQTYPQGRFSAEAARLAEHP